jgi:hypothetical protein
MDPVVFIIIAVVVLVLMLKGIVRTFQRNWLAALLLMIFLTPIWVIWAFCELFMSPPRPKVVSGQERSEQNH